uniref:Microfibrillar-associated protein 1 n=1 Tax=Lepeophtheirus salmonis TaxID=72036 RepID=C1BVS1_LEPSM|nr:Microfibrillar-associated protein 1 [Lepeophtheirus salmonis]
MGDGDRFDNRYFPDSDPFGVRSTAGAIPVINQKGQVSMQKVKVRRYVSGKRPDFAHASTSESESGDEDEETQYKKDPRRRHDGHAHDENEDEEEEEELMSSTFRLRREEENEGKTGEEDLDMNDPRIRRLLAARNRCDPEKDEESDEEDRISRHRRIHEPEVLSDDNAEKQTGDRENESDDSSSDDDDDDNDDLDEEGISRRRELMRQRALMKAQIGEKEEIMDIEEEKSGEEDKEDSSSSEEETTDSEDSDGEGAKLKPIFVRKRDRLTVQEREREAIKQRQAEKEAAQLAEQRRRQTVKMVEEDVRKQMMARKATDNDPAGLNEVNTDDENEEIEYEAWKLRELKRIKRDREDNESMEKDKEDIERFRNMTEAERRLELKNNPKVVTNKSVKGKYKFMQKYYHRGVFFMHEENNLLKRDYSSATLEDKFDKTVLPKVMQVKNFGRSGRTKYTHLVDQDTTSFDAPWSQETAQSIKFQLTHAGGMKQQFHKPSIKKKS